MRRILSRARQYLRPQVITIAVPAEAAGYTRGYGGYGGRGGGGRY